jgi:hypothetical protein
MDLAERFNTENASEIAAGITECIIFFTAD